MLLTHRPCRRQKLRGAHVRVETRSCAHRSSLGRTNQLLQLFQLFQLSVTSLDEGDRARPEGRAPLLE